jgi:hypothetical protein
LSEEILHFFRGCLEDAPFGIKMKALDCLLAIVGHAPGCEVVRIGRCGFLAVFFDLLRDVEIEVERKKVLEAIDVFLGMGVVTHAPNSLEDIVYECGGIEVLWNLAERVEGAEGGLADGILAEYFQDVHAHLRGNGEDETFG